jgi:hypothetical protein
VSINQNEQKIEPANLPVFPAKKSNGESSGFSRQKSKTNKNALFSNWN